jgi:hypothetical protein
MKVVYRVINAIFGVLVFVAAFFLNFFHIELGTSENLTDFLYSVTDNETGAVAVTEEFSIKRIIDLFTWKDSLSSLLNLNSNGSFLWPDEFHSLNARIIIFLASFAIALILGIVIIVFACVSNKRLPNVIFGVLGIIAVIAMIASFNSMSSDIYDGKVNVIDYVVDSLFTNELITTIVGAAASTAVTLYICLAGMQNGLLFIFIGVAVWSLINILVDVGDPKAKAEQEALKAAKAEKKANKKAAKQAKKEAKTISN